MRRLVRAFAAVTLLVLAASGCGFHGVYSLPLPGAVATGAHTYTVKVRFADVLDLVPYSAVKVNGATVGHVRSIGVEGRHALVACQLLDSVHLPANAVARVEQTSVLGEKFVELEPPSNVPPTGHLGNGDVIGLDRTNTDASVEEVLGALSMLLNGGGVGQLHTITHELSTALAGRTGAARDLLDNLNVFVSGLDAQKFAILRALDGLDTLTRTVRRQEGSLVGALDRLPGAVKILADDRRRLTTMLVAVQHLGDVAANVIHASHQDLVANLRSLEPTLTKLGRVGKVIPDTLGVLITYPTADSVEQEYFGDYGNLSMTIDMSAASLLHTFGPGGGTVVSRPPARRHGTAPGGGGAGPLPGVVKKLPLNVTRRAPGSTIDGLLLGPLT